MPAEQNSTSHAVLPAACSSHLKDHDLSVLQPVCVQQLEMLMALLRLVNPTVQHPAMLAGRLESTSRQAVPCQSFTVQIVTIGETNHEASRYTVSLPFPLPEAAQIGPGWDHYQAAESGGRPCRHMRPWHH